MREYFDEDSGTGSFLITIEDYPVQPHENNLFRHDGNPPLSAFRCDMTEVMKGGLSIGAYCLISDANTENIPGYYECSRHGKCDTHTGTCTCERGYRGEACFDVQDDEDIFTQISDGPFFKGSIIKVKAMREPSSEFSYLKVVGSKEL